MAKAAESTVNWMRVLGNLGIVVLGSIVGKITGSAIGRLSGIGGIGVAGLGFVLLDKMDDKKWIGYFTIGTGAGMIASPVMEVAPSSVKGLSGFGAFAEDFKEGAKSSTRNLATKFYLDKTPLAKYLPESINGFGSIEQPTEEEAQRIIDEMIEENRKKQLKGADDEEIAGIMEDYRLNGNLIEDYKISGVDDEEMGKINWKAFHNLSPAEQAKTLQRIRHNKKHKKHHAAPTASVSGLAELDEILAGNDMVFDYMR